MDAVVLSTGLREIVAKWYVCRLDGSKCLEYYQSVTACLLKVYDTCLLTPDKRSFSTQYDMNDLYKVVEWIARTIATDDQGILDTPSMEEMKQMFARSISTHQIEIYRRAQRNKIQESGIPVDAVMSCLSIDTQDETKEEVVDLEKQSDEEEDEESEEEDEGDEEDDEDEQLSSGGTDFKM